MIRRPSFLLNLFKDRSRFFTGLILFIIALIFRGWFHLLPLSTGDWSYKFPQTILDFKLYPYAWGPTFNNGMGGSTIFLLPLNTFFVGSASILFSFFHLPWVLIEKLVWFWPYLIIAVSGSYFLFRRFVINDNMLALVSSLIFTTNTYSLMVTGGGQIGVGAAYALIPWVFWGFLNTLESTRKHGLITKSSIVAGLILSLQLVFDLRIVYVTLVSLSIYYLFYVLSSGFFESIKKSIVPFFIVPGVITLFLHFFWILPLILAGQNPVSALGAAYTGSGIVDFLSFAKLENTISLLHPNWPDNLFGKAYFMRPEFLIVPILGFGSLLFSPKNKKASLILVFCTLSLLGAFLSKGTNDPFGSIYKLAFEKVPGFIMFRDSTKWYGMTALSFSLLIPYFLFNLSEVVKRKIKKIDVLSILVLIFLALWSFTIRQAVMGEVKGTFAPQKSPQQYAQLTNFLDSQKEFFRALWVPSFHQYTYMSSSHPAIPAGDFLNAYSAKTIAQKIRKSPNLLADSSIKYLIVPDDVYGKIFTDDRKYSDKLYQEQVSLLNGISGLRKVAKFDNIVVYENASFKDHFWSRTNNLKIKYRSITPTMYQVWVDDAKKGDTLVFSEAFDKNWVAAVSGVNISSLKYESSLNSFVLPRDGNFVLTIAYKPQRFVDIGLIVSAVSLFVVLMVLTMNKSKIKK